MLAIVEQQHEPFTPKGIGDALDRDAPPAQIEPQCRGNRSRNKIGIGQRRQLGDPHPVGKFPEQMSHDLDAKARLADPAFADQG